MPNLYYKVYQENLFNQTYCFQVQFTALDSFEDVCHSRFKTTANENSLCQVIKNNVPESIFVPYIKKKPTKNNIK